MKWAIPGPFAITTRFLIDASIVLIAHDGDEIITSDIEDLKPLATASGRHLELVRP
jgi:hypothetical protein